MADNDNTLPDPADGRYEDWFEIYNGGAEAVNLQGLYLTDDTSNPTRHPITQTVTIAAGGFAIFWADDETNQGPYHVNFKLDADGEEIAIFDTDGATQIDGHTFGPQATDVSEGRCPDGGLDWLPFTLPTPGVTNEPCGPAPIISGVVHTPTLPSAIDSVKVTATITDDGAVIAATLWYSTGAGFAAIPMTPSAGDDYLASIPSQPNGTWVGYYVQAEDDQGLVAIDPPGAPTHTHRYLVGYQPPLVVLNELMADNVGAVEDPDSPGAFPDWFELHNPGPGPMGLGGLYLTDDLGDSSQFRISDSITIPVGGFVVFWADNDPEQGPFHTNFALDADGEVIGLYGAEGTVQVDAVEFPAQTPNKSYGRLPDGTGDWEYLACFSAGRPNQDCYPAFLPLILSGP